MCSIHLRNRPHDGTSSRDTSRVVFGSAARWGGIRSGNSLSVNALKPWTGPALECHVGGVWTACAACQPTCCCSRVARVATRTVPDLRFTR